MIPDFAARLPRCVFRAVSLATVLVVFGAEASAEVTISDKPTRGVKCSDGVCLPKKANANLNVVDLANMLAAGDVKVASDNVAMDIRFAAPLSWTSKRRLTLDSYRSIAFEQSLTVAGKGAVTIVVGHGSLDTSDFRFDQNGHIEFWDLKSSLTINGFGYTLVKSVKQLANEIVASRSSLFALAKSYNAAPDGTYSQAPIPNFFNGVVEGLGNNISGLAIDDVGDSARVGLFGQTASGEIRDLELRDEHVSAEGAGSIVGGMVGDGGPIVGCRVSGSISGGQYSGGFAGIASDIIQYSYSSANVQGSNPNNSFSAAGGIAGAVAGGIFYSYASGQVGDSGNAYVGGLAGIQQIGEIAYSYSTGAVAGGNGARVGGLLGGTNDQVAQSYATGVVAGGTDALIGGLVGEDFGSYDSNYWDLRTSGTHRGTGSGNVSGITGLKDHELRSSLPAGFNPTVWAQKKKINNGYPYLIANPPPQ